MFVFACACVCEEETDSCCAGMQPNGWHDNTSLADKSHLSLLVKRECVCARVRYRGGVQASQVCAVLIAHVMSF